MDVGFDGGRRDVDRVRDGDAVAPFEFVSPLGEAA
jgi:hypothetical protein